MLDSLYIRNFRCFEDLQVESLGRVNLVVGKNNTGKSTLLESVLLLASAGANQVIHEILNKRGDLLLDKQTPNLFFNGD
ncbi:MAG: AAA family ATPase, partial [Thiothrix sp.]|nr:AAA family ATPase [Thiothrix sp.]